MAESKNETLKEARKEMNYLTGNEEVRRLVELREKWKFDQMMDIRYAKKEGKIEIARKMLKKNKSIEEIIEITELTKEELGKPIGSDAEENKNTYVSLTGLEKSKELAEEYSDSAKKSLDIFGSKADFLKQFTDYLTDRRS